MKHGKHKLTSSKAKEILRHGSVKGHKLTAKQKRFMGARAGVSLVRRRKKRKA